MTYIMIGTLYVINYNNQFNFFKHVCSDLVMFSSQSLITRHDTTVKLNLTILITLAITFAYLVLINKQIIRERLKSTF